MVNLQPICVAYKIVSVTVLRNRTLDGQKRERSLILSSEANPNSIFCLSQCDMIEIPPGIFFKCNNLRKTTLDLSDNRLKEIRMVVLIT